jgi:hypothetical protein
LLKGFAFARRGKRIDVRKAILLLSSLPRSGVENFIFLFFVVDINLVQKFRLEFFLTL